MIYQDSDSAPRSRLYEEGKKSLEVEKVLHGVKARQKSFACMVRIEAPVTLQEQWVNEDTARFNAWLSREYFPYVFDYQSIPFEEWLVEKTGGQFFTPVTIKIRPEKIVETTEEKPRPPIFSVETESSVGLEEKIQVSKPQLDLENDSSEKCFNNEQGRDIGIAQETTPIDMVIGDKADMEKSHSAKLFELIMPGGHNNCLTHSATDKKSFVNPNVFGGVILFGLEKTQSENFDVKISRLRVKHRWPPPLY